MARVIEHLNKEDERNHHQSTQKGGKVLRQPGEEVEQEDKKRLTSQLDIAENRQREDHPGQQFIVLCPGAEKQGAVLAEGLEAPTLPSQALLH